MSSRRLVAVLGRTDDVLARVGAITPPEGLLSDEDRARIDQLVVEADRRSFVAARALARLLLVRHDGLPPTAASLGAATVRQRCGRCERPHGRPSVVGRDDLGLSWSHKRDVVAAVVGPGPVGVDVEHVDAVELPPAVGGRTPAQNAALTALDPTTAWLTWTRAESCVKAGLGSLATTTGWPLDWPPRSTGRTWRPPASCGGPAASASEVTLTDHIDPDMGVVCTVAGRVPAVFVTF